MKVLRGRTLLWRSGHGTPYIATADHRGLGNPSTNEEVTDYGSCKEEGTGEKGDKEEVQEEVVDA